MRQCASCRFLIGDNEVSCDYCGRIAADSSEKVVVATFTRAPGTDLVPVSSALAIPDEPIRRPRGVATAPVPAHNAYPAPYPRPWNDASGPTPAAAVAPVGAITRAVHRVRAVALGRRAR